VCNHLGHANCDWHLHPYPACDQTKPRSPSDRGQCHSCGLVLYSPIW
jgi:hypothetical protein